MTEEYATRKRAYAKRLRAFRTRYPPRQGRTIPPDARLEALALLEAGAEFDDTRTTKLRVGYTHEVIRTWRNKLT